MERVEYDPEIDPSIREEREAAERERELSARIRIEIERYVEENDLVPRSETKETGEEDVDGIRRVQFGAERVTLQDMGQATPIPPPWDNEPDEPDTTAAALKREKEARQAARREKAEAQQAARETRREQNKVRAAGRRKAAQSIFTGSILGTEWVRRMWPYMLCVVAVLVLYIGYSFHVQSLHLDRQRLEREVRELGIEAVERTAERVRQTRRSAIVERLREKGIPLEEFPDPVKRIER